MKHQPSASTVHGHVFLPSRFLLSAALAWLCAATLVGCASSSNESGLIGKTLEAVGLSKPPTPEISTEKLANLSLPKRVTLRIHAGEILNNDASGKSLSLVARIYKLRSPIAFGQAPYDTFKDAAAEKRLLNDDLVEVREIVLTPGQRYEVIESLPVEATHLAVIALLRAPDPQRWKFVFDVKDAARTGITLGAHGCALSVAEGEPLFAPPEVRRLAGMHCR